MTRVIRSGVKIPENVQASPMRLPDIEALTGIPYDESAFDCADFVVDLEEEPVFATFERLNLRSIANPEGLF